MQDDNIGTFWQRLAATRAGLLGTQNGAARMVPMRHQVRAGDTSIWFLTARDTDLAEAAEHGRTPASYMIADEGKGLFAVIHGDLLQRHDTALRDDLWTPAADNWFRGGKTDPRVCILGLVPLVAEIWLTPTSGISFAFNVVRAQVTADLPEMGSHARLSQPDFAQFSLSA